MISFRMALLLVRGRSSCDYELAALRACGDALFLKAVVVAAKQPVSDSRQQARNEKAARVSRIVMRSVRKEIIKYPHYRWLAQLPLG
jgi:hypothetical protein